MPDDPNPNTEALPRQDGMLLYILGGGPWPDDRPGPHLSRRDSALQGLARVAAATLEDEDERSFGRDPGGVAWRSEVLVSLVRELFPVVLLTVGGFGRRVIDLQRVSTVAEAHEQLQGLVGPCELRIRELGTISELGTAGSASRRP